MAAVGAWMATIITLNPRKGSIAVSAKTVNNALKGALRGVRERNMPDGSPCWCAEPFADDDDTDDHSDYCAKARKALALNVRNSRRQHE